MSVFQGVTKSSTAKSLRCTEESILETNSAVKSKLLQRSFSGESFSWMSTDTDIDVTDTRLAIRNTGSKFLIFSHMIVNSSNVACKWSVRRGFDTDALSGTTVTAFNLNGNQSTTTENAEAVDDETALAAGTQFMAVGTPLAFDSRTFSLEGVILGMDQYIQINQETESTSGQVTVFGYFSEHLE
jgi:hypothetical protein